MTDHTAPDALTTHDAAVQLGAYPLARRWLERPRPDNNATGALDHLAVMAGLRTWLTRWLPLQVHEAVQNGATLDQVAAATGMTVAEVRAHWQEWADGQRALYEREQAAGQEKPIGLPQAQYDAVHAVLNGDA
ncbi:MAG: hypothetical protein ACLGI3_16880 [Actinomycetes bacterium]